LEAAEEFQNVFGGWTNDTYFKVTIMSAPRVFAGMFVTLIVFAIVTYCMTGSLVISVLESIAAAILLQLGYFLCIGFMVWKQAKRSAAPGESESAGTAESAREEKRGRLPGAPFNQSGPFGR
jgi:exopolysaccharide production repressor protein